MTALTMNLRQIDDISSDRIFLEHWLLGLIPSNTSQDRKDVYHAIATILAKRSRKRIKQSSIFSS